MTLNRFKLDFACLYAGNVYKLHRMSSQKVEVVNNGNIPTRFKWLGEDNEDLQVSYSPEEGVIEAKESMVIDVELRVNRGGAFSYIMICEVDGLEFPLGIQIDTQVKGL